MPIIKSAVKRVRQTKSRTTRNSAVKRRLHASERQLDSALASSSKKELLNLMSKLQSNLDTAVKKNLIHKNTAARTKQRYSKLISATGAKATTAPKTKKPATKKTASTKAKK